MSVGSVGVDDVVLVTVRVEVEVVNVEKLVVLRVVELVELGGLGLRPSRNITIATAMNLASSTK